MTVTGGAVTVTGAAVTVDGGDVTVDVTVLVTGGRALAAHTRTFASVTHCPGFRTTLLRSTPAAAVPAANRASATTETRTTRAILRTGASEYADSWNRQGRAR